MSFGTNSHPLLRGSRSLDHFEITLADDATFNFGTIDANAAGVYLLRNTSDSQFTIFHLSASAPAAGVGSEDDMAYADTDTKVCLYASGGNLILKNRLGSSKTFRLSRLQ